MSEIVLTPAQAIQLAVSVGDNAITTVVHPGPQGPPGEAGVGIPSGGTSGDFFVKTSSEDYEAEWRKASLSDLSDVDISGKVDKSVIVYNENTGRFVADSVNTTLSLTDGGNF